MNILNGVACGTGRGGLPSRISLKLISISTVACALFTPVAAEDCREDLGWMCSDSNQNQIRMTIVAAGGRDHGSDSSEMDGTTSSMEPDFEGNFGRQCIGGIVPEDDLVVGNVLVAGGWTRLAGLSTVPIVLIWDPSGDNKDRFCWTGPFDPVDVFRASDPGALFHGCSQNPPPNRWGRVTGNYCEVDPDIPETGEVYFYSVLPAD